jgi:THO complex subunit 3
MAPTTNRRTLVPKDRFAYVFGGQKTQSYHDPAARGPGSHTYVLLPVLNFWIQMCGKGYKAMKGLSQRPRTNFTLESFSIRTLAWNTTGQLIATGSVDRTLRIWNPERANVKYSTELRGHIAGIEKVVFNPVRDSELASCSSDGTVRFWDVRSKNCVSRLDVGGEAFTMTWSADGSVVLVGRKVIYPLLSESKGERKKNGINICATLRMILYSQYPLRVCQLLWQPQ